MTDKEAGAKITALRKSGNALDAVTMGRNELKNFPTSWSVRGALAWALWEAHIKNAKIAGKTDRRIVGIVEEIRTLSDFSLYGEISVFVTSVIDASLALAEAGYSKDAVDLLTHVDITKLTLTKSNMKQNGTIRILPSQKERWYLAMTKCLDHAKEFTQLETVCEEALKSDAFTSERDKIWIRYRLGLSRIESNPESALQIFDLILKDKNEWWLHQQRALCLKNLGRSDEAFQELRIALGGVRPDNIQMATNVMINIFELTDDETMKRDLLQALRAIRIANDWKLNDEFEALAKDLACGDPQNFDYKNVIKQYGDLTIQKNIVKKTSFTKAAQGKKLQSELRVVVKALIGDGENAGFVRTDTGAEFYFSRSDNPAISWPPLVGAALIGELVETFDKKKNKDSAKFVSGKSI